LGSRLLLVCRRAIRDFPSGGKNEEGFFSYHYRNGGVNIFGLLDNGVISFSGNKTINTGESAGRFANNE
jgi:hypothetical protein